MPDQEALAAFADFMRGFAVRLLLYPGGLFALLLGLLCARLLHLRRGAADTPRAAQTSELQATVALALAWTGWALLPLPGATPLLWAPDLLVVLALLAAAGLLGPRVNAAAASGRGLLLAAPLIWALLGGAASSVLIARCLVVAAYLLGLATYARPGFRPDGLVGWLLWFAWVALPLALLMPGDRPSLVWPAAWTGEPWIGVIVVAVLLLLATALAGTRPARWIGGLAWSWGWVALVGALFVALIAR